MSDIEIKDKIVCLVLTTARGMVRIADSNGNHISKPTEAINDRTHYIEWMIRNDEVVSLVKEFLSEDEIQDLVADLRTIDEFIRDTKYATREATRPTEEKLEKFLDFDIYRYTENFFSFEKRVASGVKIRVTFKMGDYTLAPHLFVLVPFAHHSLRMENRNGDVNEGDTLGSKCMGMWNPDKNDVIEVAKSLGHISRQHRDDIISLLES